MRALVISDIHANLPALEAVLAAAPQHDAVWNLGDIVGYGARPNEVVELVRNLVGIVVRGNHDRACSRVMPPREFRDFPFNFRSYAIWTRRVLSKDNVNWLAKLPRGPIMPLGNKVQCIHGMPENEAECISFREDAWAVLRSSLVRIIFYGNTHCQVGWSWVGGEATALRSAFLSKTKAEHFELPIRKRHRYLINPGSVGQPRDGDRRAAFAIYDDAQSLLTWYRVPYEVRTAQKRIRRAGLPEGLATRLGEGT